MKLKIVRVVTESYIVSWHLHNMLVRMPRDFEVYVVGSEVSKNKDIYPDVTFVDICINRKINIFSDVLALAKLTIFLFRCKPDVVHSIMPKAALLAALAGYVCRVPVRIHTFTGQVWATKNGLNRYILLLIDRLINALNTICLTDSLSQSKFLFENKISCSGQPLLVLSKGSLSGVDVAKINKESLGNQIKNLRNSLGLNKRDFVFGFIARKTRDKGVIDMLKAFSLVNSKAKNCKLLFVGPDEDGEVASLRKISPELFVNVIDVGRVNNHEVYLALTDVLCLPSYREGFGSIVIDAAALGVPTIGSNIPGLTDSIVDGETGVLFPVGDFYKLADIMFDLAFINRAKSSMGRAASLRVREFFTADILYQELKNLYLDIVDDNDIKSLFKV
jgi:glycosyltransferase involved in cell wall biosynthesis